MIKLPFLSKNISKSFQFPRQVKHVRFPSISRQRETRKLFSIISLTLRIIRTRSSIFYYLVDMNVYTRNLPVCNSGPYIYITRLFNFFFVLQDLIDRINSYFQRIVFQRNLLLTGFTEMALRKLVRRNYGGKSPVSIKYENLQSLKEGVILLCQSILETRRILHLHGSALFTIPLKFQLRISHYFHN